MSLLSMACQKESITTTPSEVLVKTKSEGNNMETYFYDSQKRLAKIVFTTATGTSYYHEYTYSGNEISEYRSEEPVYALEQTLPGGAVRINCTSNPSLLKLNDRGLYLETASTKNGETTHYTYVLDAQQRVSTQTTIKGSTQTVVTYTYY